MANFPFDATPVLPHGHQAINVIGRPARVRVISLSSAPLHEDWVIATIVPVPDQQVPFANVRQILGEFIQEVKQLGFSKITPSHFGQAYVKLNHLLDRDTLGQPKPTCFWICSCFF